MRIMMATPFISPCIGEDERTPRQHLDAVDVHRPGVRPTNLTFIFIAALDVRRLTSFNNFESSVITCPFLKREYTCELTGLTPPVTRSSPGVTCNFTTHMAPVRLVCELTKGTPGGSVLPVHKRERGSQRGGPGGNAPVMGCGVYTCEGKDISNGGVGGNAQL